VVAAASDMVEALPELGHDFEAHSGVKVIPSFGPSGGLAQQIANGAPFDVFLSADRRFLDNLVATNHVEASSRRIYAIGKIVLYAPTIHLARVIDLRSPEIRRISIANPETAPYGRAAKQALERSGIWKDVESKVVIAENVRQALDMAETGNVDATITALSLVMRLPPATKLIVPDQLYDPIQQEAGIVIHPDANRKAHTFLYYIGSTAGKRILMKYGFSLPDNR